MAERGVARDLRQPCPQPFRLAQFVKFPPGGEKRLLRRVLARREIAEDSQRDPGDHRLVPRHNFHKRPLVPLPRSVDQFDIRRVWLKCWPAGVRVPFSQVDHCLKTNVTIYLLDAASGVSVTRLGLNAILAPRPVHGRAQSEFEKSFLVAQATWRFRPATR